MHYGVLEDMFKRYRSMQTPLNQISVDEEKLHRPRFSDHYRQSIIELSNSNKVQFYYDKNKLAGFGWLHPQTFIYHTYSGEVARDAASATKALVCKEAKYMRYMLREVEGTEYDMTPIDFMMTLFHVCFVYPQNISVVSKLSRDVVYNQNFHDERILKGIDFDRHSNKLLAYSYNRHIQVASLVGEDKIAWRFYLKKNRLQESLQACSDGKMRAKVRGNYAESLFEKGHFDRAAKDFAQSDFLFERITAKLMTGSHGVKPPASALISYLEGVFALYKEKADSWV